MLLLPGLVSAGGPLHINDDTGFPSAWSTTSPVTLNLDPGPLGEISNPTTLIEHAVGQWNGVATSTLTLSIGPPLAMDIENLTESAFDTLVYADDGTNPVIFDSTGAIFEDMFGAESGVLGLAGPSLVLIETEKIVKSFALFNGEHAKPSNLEIFKAAVTHELGHFLNLEHTQINGLRVGEAIPGFGGTVSVDDVATMHPVLPSSSLVPHPMATLHKDDERALSALYPTPTFASTTSAITGHVRDLDGVNFLQGVNVIARNINQPFEDAVSFVSGLLAPSGTVGTSTLEQGKFELRGLTPNATYNVYIEEVESSFTEGGRVGPVDPPLDLDLSETAAFLEFWNDTSESSENPPDDPLEATDIMLSAGETRSQVDFVFNGTRPRVYSIAPSAGSYLEPQEVTLTGANFLEADLDEKFGLLLSGPTAISIVTLTVDDASSLTADLPAGLVPGVYNVIVETPRGENDPGDAQYTVTEPPPTITMISVETTGNSTPQPLTILGVNLLGAQSARLAGATLPDVGLSLLQVVSASRVEAEVPAGAIPGTYSVFLTNTTAESPPSPTSLEITELAPVLSGVYEPPGAVNTGTVNVRILGDNLVGTVAVDLLDEEESIPLIIVSTSLESVVVTVPGGLQPRSYLVRVTNSQGAAESPTPFLVRAGKSRSKGGCSAVLPTAGGGHWDLPLILATLTVFVGLRRRRVLRAAPQGET